MKAHKKVFLAISCCILIAISSVLSLHAANVSTEASDQNAIQDKADALYSLSLFLGYGKDENGIPVYGLNDNLERQQGIILLLRMLGEEQNALNSNYTMPFTDVDDYAQKYVAYAYHNGLTKGTSDTTFEGTAIMNQQMFITFCLRALGYSDSGYRADFQWDKSTDLAKKLNITTVTESTFNRGNTVAVIWDVLKTNLKNSTDTLADDLITRGVITQTSYTNAQAYLERNILETPLVSKVENNTICWSTIANADFYKIYVTDENGTTYSKITEACIYNLTDTLGTINTGNATFLISVQAMDSEHAYKTSEKSEPYLYSPKSQKLAAPIISQIENNIVYWSPVENADSYQLYITDSENITYTRTSENTSYDLANIVNLKGSIAISIQALNSTRIYNASEQSEPYLYTFDRTDTYTIHYENMKSASNDNNPTSYPSNIGVKALQNPTVCPSGYTFIGWYDQCDNTGNGTGNVITKIEPNSGDVTLYAKWHLIRYSITYFTGTDRATFKDNSYVENSPLNAISYTVESNIKLYNATYAGLLFDCWQDEDGNTVTEIPKGTTGDITLTAKWKSNTNIPHPYDSITNPKYDRFTFIEDNQKYQYYFVYYLGYIDNVVLQKGNICRENIGVADLTFTTINTDATTISNSVSNITSDTDSWQYGITGTIGAESFGISASVSVSETLGQTHTETTDLTQIITDYSEKSKSEQVTISKDSPKGYYINAILGSIDVWAVIVYDAQTNTYLTNTVSEISENVNLMGWLYSPESSQFSDITSCKLDFEPPITDITEKVSEIKAKYTIEFDFSNIAEFDAWVAKYQEYKWICNKEDLQSIEENQNYVLAKDIDLSGSNWTPIESFNGCLDGNGKTISGLYIEGYQDTYKDDIGIGLFAKVNSTARICNLTLSNCNVNIPSNHKGSGYLYVGILCGCLQGGEVYDVTVYNSTIECHRYNSCYGIIIGNANFGSIEKCEVHKSTVYGNGDGAIITANATDTSIDNCSVYNSTIAIYASKENRSNGSIIGYADRCGVFNCVVDNTSFIYRGSDNNGLHRWTLITGRHYYCSLQPRCGYIIGSRISCTIDSTTSSNCTLSYDIISGAINDTAQLSNTTLNEAKYWFRVDGGNYGRVVE